ncbi:MAG: polysaccharide biosynthesis C-terminal domain-containing protein [Ginsengibacter sp.]
MNIQKLIYQNIFWRGLFVVSAFLLNILIARHFDAAITGWIYYLFTIFSFFTLLGSFSLESGLIFFGSKKEIPLERLGGFSLIWTLMIAVLIVLIYFILAISGIDIPVEKFQYALLFICGSILLTFITGLFYAQQNYITSNIVGITINILLIILLLNINSSSRLTDEIFISIYFGSFLLAGGVLLLLFFQRSTISNFGLINREQSKKLFRYSMLVFLSNVVFFLLYKIDYWFVNKYCSPEELGNYIQISKVGQMFLLLPGILSASLFPLIAGNHIAKLEDALKTISRTIFFFYLLGCGFLVIVGKWLFPFVFGDSFSGMYQPFLFLIPGILSLSMVSTMAAYFSGKNRVSINLTGSFIALVVIITGDALLIPKYGIAAAAAVSSVGYLTYHIFVLYTFHRMHHSRVIDFFYFRLSDLRKLKESVFKNTKLL